MKFEELGLVPELLSTVERAGFEEATPIQSEIIPLALAGKDVIGQAQTGTRKTATFGLPTLNKIDADNRVVQGLVIAPARELAIQTQEELFRLDHDKKIRVQAAYGGADIDRQVRGLKDRPHIVVGTPGRLLDHVNRRILELETIETLVLDEADKILNVSFSGDIKKIIPQVPEQRQTLLFSATIPPAIRNTDMKFMRQPEHIKIKAKEMTADSISRYYVRSKDFEKFDIMTRLLDVQALELTIVFDRARRRVDGLARELEARGYKVGGIHGDLSQQKRISVLRSFKNGNLDILVATDIAAHGLNISGITHVYNYDIPQDPESYVCRIDRTGHAGKGGMSVAFVTSNEMSCLHVIENLAKKRMTLLYPPTKKEAFKGQLSTAVETIEGDLEGNGLDKYLESTETLLEKYSATGLAALLLKTAAKDPTDAVPVKVTPERSLPSNKKGFDKNGRGDDGGNNRNRNCGDNGKGGSYRGNKNYKDGGHNYKNSDRKNKDQRGDKRHNDKKRGLAIHENAK